MKSTSANDKNHQPSPLFDTLENHQPEQKLNIQIPVASAHEDYHHAVNFLYSYRGSQMTFNAYRREVERLLQWCWYVTQKSLNQLNRADVESYLEFCQTPPKSWIGTKHVDRFLLKDGLRQPNPEWRPFIRAANKKNYELSKSAVEAIFSILSSFYNYLEQEDYVTVNPVSQIRQKSKFIRKQQNKRQIRRLSELQWSYVIETAEILAKENPAVHERTLFIMNALFAMYLRISELAASSRWAPEMSDFYKDMDGNWWFKTVGKGNKERDISVSDAMLNALKRYRLSRELSALPSLSEQVPLIPRQTSKGPISDTRQIRNIVQRCFDRAMERLKADGFHDEAEALVSATVHWLRHTGISEDVKIRPREHVRDDAGHSSSAITDRYIDIELRARHASARKKVIKPE